MKTLFFIAAFASTPALADPVLLTGAIGPYGIEVELEHDQEAISGRYRYEGRDAWIDLSGEAHGQDAVALTETVDGIETGTFYLGVVAGQFEGFWSNGERDFVARLMPTSGEVSDVFAPAIVPDVGPSLTGRYGVGYHWVNDWFAPNYEIGFNGGEANVVELAPNIILVGFEFLVGPTYHFANFQGLATQTADNVFVHDAPLDGGETTCRLVFTFEEGTLEIDDIDNGFACHFGMRAHANFGLTKVSDTAEFGGDW